MKLRIPLQQAANFDQVEMNKDFLALFLPRMQCFLMSNSDFKLTKKIIRDAKTAIQTLLEEDDAETHEIIFTQLINFSGALIQDANTVERANKYLNNFPKKYSLTDEQQKKFNEAFSLFKELLKTSLVKWALNKVMIQPSFQAINDFKADEMVEILQSMTVTWIERAVYFGMVGLSGLFLDEGLFHLMEPEWTVPRIVGLCFHEGFHYAQRVLIHNFAAITLPSLDPKHLEGGYLFEHYLYGHYNIAYWIKGYGNSILDVTKWNKEESLFTEDELRKGSSRGIEFPTCSGLCADTKAKDEM